MKKTADRLRALELLTRMQGGFLDKSEIKASITDYESKLKRSPRQKRVLI